MTTPAVNENILSALMALPDDPTREQVQAVLSDEFAATIMTMTESNFRIPVLGYIINHAGCFNPETVQMATKHWMALSTDDSGETINLQMTPMVASPDGDGEVPSPEEAADLGRWLRAFVPGVSVRFG